MDVYTFIVKDMDGNPITSPTTFDIIFSGTTGFQGGGGSYNGNFTFNQGDTSSEHFIWVDQAVDGSPGCPCPCSMTTYIDTFSIAATNIIGGYIINNCSNNVTPTPTPTPTPTTNNGQCYTYTVDNSIIISNTDYGVSYLTVSNGYTSAQFNSIPSESGIGGTSIYHICSSEPPVLLDYRGPSPVSTDNPEGIISSGPDGPCTTNFDCYQTS
jgi:hypothetical protein